ncbi:MAG: hypothetical protein ACD_79C00239G0001 [uncultured bacterium]|nr:MAG: hypothetical protein ACD_79C00239G0001 [uncultured bacterium]
MIFFNKLLDFNISKKIYFNIIFLIVTLLIIFSNCSILFTAPTCKSEGASEKIERWKRESVIVVYKEYEVKGRTLQIGAGFSSNSGEYAYITYNKPLTGYYKHKD